MSVYFNDEVWKILKWFEKAAADTYAKYYTYPDFGYAIDNVNCMLGIVYQLSRVYISMGVRNDKLLEEILGKACWYLANYCRINKIDFPTICSNVTLYEMYDMTKDIPFEEFSEMLRRELVLMGDMEEKDKIAFVRKVFINLFPPNTPIAFLDSTLRLAIVNNTKS